MFYRNEAESPKVSLYSPSPTREQKARQAVAEATASVSAIGGKWKMQIGAATAGSSRFKRRPDDDWTGEQEKRFENRNENVLEESANKREVLHAQSSAEGSIKESQSSPKKDVELLKQKSKGLPVAPTTNPMIAPGQVVLDKFGNFRLVTPAETKKIAGGEQAPLSSGPPKAYGGK